MIPRDQMVFLMLFCFTCGAVAGYGFAKLREILNRRILKMSLKDGPSQGDWSVFAEKVVAERDKLKNELQRARLYEEEMLEVAVRNRERIKELKDELETATKWNHSVAVCKDHTSDIVTLNGCVICLIDELTVVISEKSEKIRQLEHAITTIRTSIRHGDVLDVSESKEK